MSELIDQKEIDRAKKAELILNRVTEGFTLREIARELEVTAGTVLNIVTATPELIERYTRARMAAADLFEADIIEACINSTSETAASDRIKVDGFKWVAARRAPKVYGDVTKTDHTSSDGTMSPKPGIDLSKISTSALEELRNAQPSEATDNS